MKDNKRIYLGLDIGAKRIGVATADTIGRLAQPVGTVVADGTEMQQLRTIAMDLSATDVVIGRPRNQSGDTTLQTRAVEVAAESLVSPLGLHAHWQDESVTSVIAEERLKARKKPYTKADIDAEAATIILQDFLDS